LVSVHTGMRLSEQCTTTWSQDCLDRRTIVLTKTKNGSARTVHLNSDALTAINSIKRPGQHPGDFVFSSNYEDFSTRDGFNPCLKEAGISGYVWRCNRHTHCSWLAMSAASLSGIREAAGHKTSAASAKYAHLSPEHNKDVADRIAGIAQSRTSH
jgi:integrase